MDKETYKFSKREIILRNILLPIGIFGFTYLATLDISPANLPILLLSFGISQFLGFFLLFIIIKSRGAFWNFLVEAGYVLSLAFPFSYTTIFYFTNFKTYESFVWFFGLTIFLVWLLSFYLGNRQFQNLIRQDNLLGPLDTKKGLWDLQKAYHFSGNSYEKDKGEKWMNIGRIAIYFAPFIGSAIYRSLNNAQFFSFMGIFFFSAVIFFVSLSAKSTSFARGIKKHEKAFNMAINIKELD